LHPSGRRAGGRPQPKTLFVRDFNPSRLLRESTPNPRINA
jgi:hypothetical protein